jgi:hypothetical protein
MRKLIAGKRLASLMQGLSFVAVLCFAAAISSVSVPPASAQITNEAPPPGYPPSGCDYDQRGNYYCWGGGSNSAPVNPDKYAAIAVSDKTLFSGKAWQATSQQQAEQIALAYCKQGASDCSVQAWGKNECVALVTSMPGPSTWAVDADTNRNTANQQALKLCRDKGWKNCVLTVSVCAHDPVN